MIVEAETSSVATGAAARTDRSGWWAAGFGAVVAAVLFVLAHRALADDAYITMTYARNLAEDLHWGLLVDRGSNTQTSPLNVWLVAGGVALSGRPVLVVGALLVATFSVIGWWGSRIAAELGLRSRLVLPAVLITLLATSPLLVSTIGLETYLGVAVLAGVTRCALAGRTAWTGVLCGAAVLVRPDLAVPAGVLALLVASPGRGRAGRRLGLAVALATVVALPWHLVSWRLLGGFVPDTTWMKTAVPGVPTMVDAPVRLFWLFFPAATLVAAVPVVAALACCTVAVRRRGERWARVALVSVAAGWAHWAALALIGAFPQAWYFAPLVACSMLAVALTLAASVTAPVAGGSVAALALAGLLVAGSVPWTAMPMAVNFARSGQYAQIGSELGALTAGQAVLGPGEIGVLAFHSAVPVVDNFGDRSLTRSWTDRRYALAGDLGKMIMRFNWRYRADEPRPLPRFALLYRSLVPAPPGRILRSWPIDMPLRGTDTMVLTELR